MENLKGIIGRFRGGKDEKGFALVLTLIIMAAMTAIGMMAVTTSTTDLMIARNEKEGRTAFYLAEVGVYEAIARLSLPKTNARYVGESTTERADRVGGTKFTPSTTYPGSALSKPAKGSFTSAGISGGAVPSVGGVIPSGTYEVLVRYTIEHEDTWRKGDNLDDETVVFCRDFGFSGATTNCTTAFPVYTIISKGRTGGGTEAVISAHVVESFINMMPPGDTILFTEGEIGVQSATKITGKVGTQLGYEQGYAAYVSGCPCTDPNTCPATQCTNVSSGFPNWGYKKGDMNEYLGMDLDTIKNYADVYNMQTGNNTTTYNPTGIWGSLCSSSTTSDPNPHICDNDANKGKIVYIDNGAAGVGAAGLQAGSYGRGLLIVKGDLQIAGQFTWEGMIYVMGNLSVSGTATVFGTLMIEGNNTADNISKSMVKADVQVTGSLNVYGSRDVAASVGIGLGMPRTLRWTRL
ncbi:MAG: pilus assembly PilX N-terminal domain-containing protein [Deltaproteobacteria bacterium]|nr:pilus assembly PilX N-terminal domain-containing protein [Deltaproteobacteria bacterium]